MQKTNNCQVMPWPLCGLALIFLGFINAANASGATRILFFSKAASWEQPIIHRDGTNLSYIEKEAEKLGRANQIEFTFSKDGNLFTAENLAHFDAFLFFTSGDLTFQERNGRGDNYPLMSLAGKKAFLDAIENGKGFIGINTANFTFTDAVSPGEEKTPVNLWRYTKMIGAGYMGHNEVQKGYFTFLDRKFPGMENVPLDYAPIDQWYAFNRLNLDMHVIMALDAPKLVGNLYERPSYPVAWARMQGRGRVYYTTMGHTVEIWQDPVFLRMLLGGIRWATRSVNADLTPNLAAITPEATNIPPHASKYIAGNPPVENPRFPKFKVHYPEVKPRAGSSVPATPRKRVLFFTKSSGYEHPVAYRNGAFPCFLETEMLQFGSDHEIDFDFCKDGSIFSADEIAKYDAFVFYTSGDLTQQPRNGLGDNYPLMSPEARRCCFKPFAMAKASLAFTAPLKASLSPFRHQTIPARNCLARNPPVKEFLARVNSFH